MSKLDGEIALITGGSTGLGFATADRFLDESAKVIITGRRQAELDSAVKRLGRNALGVRGDVSKPADLDRLYAIIQNEKGHLDIVFANAGGGSFVPLGSITEDHFDQIFNINVNQYRDLPNELRQLFFVSEGFISFRRHDTWTDEKMVALSS
jgi:NAD(P)-dependent dehydrogenase (short-subunit alcohol dehydrogenase family)